ncbi:hypothetical protein [Micromonospora sp. KC721]|uniref:hypothetical protein n=1 Tax=Micromonospora sp. KC721 TaxID=2530380 RepID=UPI00105246A5|nr:hypothetical protein [Micromonospora sp. KC721]TDB70566.1 hypothetical protein E1182_27040 [Micromonospora sp. KC721]
MVNRCLNQQRSLVPEVAVTDLGESVAAPTTEVSMQGQGDKPAPSRGEQIEADEREAAKLRLLAQAEADRIPVEDTTRARPDRRWRRDQG